MVGLTAADDATVKVDGGDVTIGDLAGTGIGTLMIDGRQRASNSTASNDITAVAAAGSNLAMAPDDAGDTVLQMNYALIIPDSRPQDSLAVSFPTTGPTQSGSSRASLDAGELQGLFALNMTDAMGTTTLTQTQVSLSAVNPVLAVTITGAASPLAQTSVTVGTGQLASIQGNVALNRVCLASIDNSAAAAASIMTLTATTFTGWFISGFNLTPVLSFANLFGDSTFSVAAGDQLDVEQTPPGMNSLTVDNTSATRDFVYIVSASAPLIFNGDFSLYLGWRLDPDGTVEHLQHLTGLANVPITFNFATSIANGASVVLDGDQDPAGAAYSIEGDGDIVVGNQTLALTVSIHGFRDQDLLDIHLPGGTVDANLKQTGSGAIYLDGSARLAASNPKNPTAPNNISVHMPAGNNITLSPDGATNNSVLQASNSMPATLHIWGSMPQDSLAVDVADQLRGDSNQLRRLRPFFTIPKFIYHNVK